MSGNMQAKMLGRLEEMTAQYDLVKGVSRLDFVNQGAYANTGTIYIQGGIRTLVTVDYRFNDRYAGLKITPVTRAQLTERGRALGPLEKYTGTGSDLKGLLTAEFPHLDYASSDEWGKAFGIFSDAISARLLAMKERDETR